MRKAQARPHRGPYQYVTKPLISEVNRALGSIYAGISESLRERATRSRALGPEFASDVAAIIHDLQFEPILERFHALQVAQKSDRFDKHIWSGLHPRASVQARTDRGRYKTRIEGILKERVKATLLHYERLNAAVVYLPSVLGIVEDLLTDPADRATRAYAEYAVRSYLADLCRDEASRQPGRKAAEILPDYEFLIKRINTILTHIRREDAQDHTNDPESMFTYHFLAMRDFLVPRITFGQRRMGDASNLAARFAEMFGVAAAFFLEGELFPKTDLRDRSKYPRFEFIQSRFVERWPDTSGLLNDMHGLPIPIRGAQEILMGGLLPKRNLIIGVRGTAGSGKTTLGLALAIGLAPFGTRTFYASAEEHPDELVDRIGKLCSPVFRRLSFYRRDTKKWFTPMFIGLNEGDETRDFQGFMRKLVEARHAIGGGNEVESAPLLRQADFPLLIVIDAIHDFFDETFDNGYGLPEFIADCEKLDALVLLTSAADAPSLDALDYLSDIAVGLEHRNTEALDAKPARVISLKKTRHQASRLGAHLFHMSGDKGLRIYPQLASSADVFSIFSQRLPDTTGREGVCDTLERNLISKEPRAQNIRHLKFIHLFPRSHVVLHGKGSSGKAGLGLKLLSAPFLKSGKGRQRIRSDHAPRILVVSFLYQREYYLQLLKKCKEALRLEYAPIDGFDDYAGRLDGRDSGEVLDVIHCYPGHLSPENLYAKVLDKLDEGDWFGAPYTGVLLDGLHNVFVQFPQLQKSQMIWSLLLSMFRARRNLTVVTTHTTLTVGPKAQEYSYQLEQDRPFLNAIIQSSDFYLEINAVDDVRGEALPGLFELRAITAIGQSIPTTSIYWSRELLMSFRRELDRLELGNAGKARPRA